MKYNACIGGCCLHQNGQQSLKIKTQKQKSKPDNPDENLNNYPARSKCGEVPLSSRMTIPSTLSKKDP
jgi:hypothetical protein